MQVEPGNKDQCDDQFKDWGVTGWTVVSGSCWMWWQVRKYHLYECGEVYQLNLKTDLIIVDKEDVSDHFDRSF